MEAMDDNVSPSAVQANFCKTNKKPTPRKSPSDNETKTKTKKHCLYNCLARSFVYIFVCDKSRQRSVCTHALAFSFLLGLCEFCVFLFWYNAANMRFEKRWQFGWPLLGRLPRVTRTFLCAWLWSSAPSVPNCEWVRWYVWGGCIDMWLVWDLKLQFESASAAFGSFLRLFILDCVRTNVCSKSLLERIPSQIPGQKWHDPEVVTCAWMQVQSLPKPKLAVKKKSLLFVVLLLTAVFSNSPPLAWSVRIHLNKFGAVWLERGCTTFEFKLDWTIRQDSGLQLVRLTPPLFFLRLAGKPRACCCRGLYTCAVVANSKKIYTSP